MFTAFIPSNGTQRTSRIGEFFLLLRLVARQARLALGVKGIVWASVAGIVGLVCCIVSIVEVTVSLRAADIDRTQRDATETATLDQAYREVMRTINAMSLGAIPARPDQFPAVDAWARFGAVLATACTRDVAVSAKGQRLSALCDARLDLFSRIGPEIGTYDPPRRMLQPAISRELIAISRDINDMTELVEHDAALLVSRMSSHYQAAIVVMTLSTAGFAAAGLVLILLVGRAAALHHEQWRNAAAAAASASEARDLLNETIDALPAGAVLYDTDERLILFNSVAASMTPALRQPGVIGRTYEDLTTEAGKLREAMGLGDGAAWTAEQVARFRSKGRSSTRQLPDGRWFEMFETSTRSGRTVGLRVDITALKNHELEVERARANYQALVDSLSDVVVAIDDKGMLTFVSAAAYDLFSLNPDQLVGTHIRGYIDPADWKSLTALAQELRASSGDEVRQIEFRLMSGGQRRHVEARMRRSLGVGGTDSVLSGVLRDVEERVQLRRRLDDEMARLQSIVESSGATIVMADRDLRVVMVNSEFAALKGISKQDAVGQPLTEVIGYPLDHAVLRRWLEGPLDRERAQPVRYSHTLTDPAGRERIVNVTANPVLDDERMVRNIVFLGVDDTARRETEIQLFDAERMKGIGEMAATVAHEVNQPLQVIRLATEVSIEEMDEARARGGVADPAFLQAKLERIMTQVERASRLVRELRAHSRSTTGEEANRFDLGAAVHGAVDLTQHTVQQSGIALKISLADEMPQVFGHMSRLEQVLINLINNARDSLCEWPAREQADRPRQIVISAAPVPHDGRAFLRLTVEDTGPGIAEHVLPRLFVPFVTTKGRDHGTGLGLPLCQRIVGEMGGTISAGNRAEGGACFEILLPAASAPLSAVA